MDPNRLKQFVDPFWDDSILPSITEYIRIPTSRRTSIRSGSSTATWRTPSR